MSAMTQSPRPAPNGDAGTSASQNHPAVAGTEPGGPTRDDGLKSARAHPRDQHAGGTPTVRDVARIAGVSIATVSRVVNGNPHVRDTTRAAVLQAIGLVGYERNEAAASMRRMHKVALPVDREAFSGEAIASERSQG